MGHLPVWIEQVPFLISLVAILFVPGYISLLLAGARRSLAMAFGPAWTCGLVGVSTIALDLASIPWGWPAFLGVTACSGAAAFVFRRFAAHKGYESVPIGGPAPYSAFSTGWRLVVGLAVGGSVLAHWAPVLATVDPLFPSDRTDPMFHYNGVNAVLNTQNASTFGALDGNYGIRVLPVTYPSIWHALVALVSTSGNILAPAHVMSYLVIPMVFVIGITCLALEVFPRNRMVAVIAPITAVGFVAFPGDITLGRGFWPNALAIALLPAVLAFAVAVISDMRLGAVRSKAVHFLGSAVVLAVGVAGIVIAHPTLLFTLMWVGAPGLVVGGCHLVRRLRRAWSRRPFLAFAGGSAIGASTLLVAIFAHPQVRAALTRPVQGAWEDIVTRLVSSLVVWPMGQDPVIVVTVVIAYASVITVGIVVAWRYERSRWLVSAWTMQTILILGAYFPLPFVSHVAGLWYFDLYRLFAIQVPFVAVLLSIAAATLFCRSRKISWSPAKQETSSLSSAKGGVGRFVGPVAAAAFGAFHLAVGSVLSAHAVYGEAGPAIGEGEIIGSAEELALLEQLDAYVPHDSIIVGDPLTGVGYAPVLGDVDSVFTQFSRRELDVDGNYLAENFDDIREDPAVCDILEHYGIGYFYEDEPVDYEGESREEATPGFYEVDTGDGFTLVESAGAASLWRIDACGPIAPAADWWDREWRMDPVLDRSAAESS